MIPTPSQPINNWNILPAVTRTIIATKKTRRKRKNRFAFGSLCMYQEANWRIDQVTYSAMGTKMAAYMSYLMVRGTTRVGVVSHDRGEKVRG